MIAHVRTVLLALGAVGVLALASSASPAAAAVRGAAIEAPGTLGCLTIDGASRAGAGTCGTGRSLARAWDVAVSPDGHDVYVTHAASAGNPAGIDAFRRDPATGALTQPVGPQGCVTTTGASLDGGPGSCAIGRGVGQATGQGLTFSPDGRFLYTANQSLGIAVFARDPDTGALTQLPGTRGCYTTDGASEHGAGTCRVMPILHDGVWTLTMGPGGHQLYSAQVGSNKLVTLDRDTTTGDLTYAGCLATYADDGCTAGRQVGYGQRLSITPDGRHAYTAQYNRDGVAVLDRDPATGQLSQPAGAAGCVSTDGSDGGGVANVCGVGRAIDGAIDTMLSLDGRTLWVYSYGDMGIATFRVTPETGALTQLAGTTGCVTLDGSGGCADARGLNPTYGLTLSPDGGTLYGSVYGGLVAFSVDAETGQLTQLPGTDGCLTFDTLGNPSDPTENAAGTCGGSLRLPDAYSSSIAISPDGNSLYEAAPADDGTLSVFARQVAPACAGATAAVPYGTATAVAPGCTDFNADPLTIEIVTPPAHGTVTASGAGMTYTPADGFSGADGFSYRASDGAGPGATATATVAVGADPGPPGGGTTPPPGGGTTPPPGGGGTTPGGGGVPKLTLALLTTKKDGPRLTKRGIRIRVKVSAAARVTASLGLSKSTAKKAHMAKAKPTTVAAGSASAKKAGTVTIVLKPTRKAKKALLKLRGRALRAFRPTLTVGAVTPANVRAKTLTKSRIRVA